MERTRMTLIVAMIALAIIAFCGIIQESEGGGSSSLSIDKVDYDPSLGTLTIEGTALSSSIEACVVAENYISQYFSFFPDNGHFSGQMRVGDLKPGVAKVTIFTSVTTKAEKSFIVPSLYISSVDYDSEKGIVTVSGVSTERSVEISIKSPTGDSTPYYSFITEDGLFSGEMNVGVLVAGDYEVTAFTSSSNVAKKTFTVSGTIIHATGISLDRHKVDITATNSTSLVATVSPSNATDSVIWSTSNNLIVEVSQNGLLIPKACGKATIKVKAGEFEDTCEVSVGYAQLLISSAEISLYVGDSSNISITVPSGYDESDKSKYVWRISSGQGKISLDYDGKVANVSAKYPGMAVITAIYDNLYEASCEIKISERPPSTDTYEYTFLIRMDFCAEDANTGDSGFDAASLKDGVVISAVSTDAGTALEKALNDSKIPCSFFSGAGGGDVGTVYHWVDNIFGLGDYQYSNGTWRYWIQYHNGVYNNLTLGYYKEGGHFEIIYGMTGAPDSGDDAPVIMSATVPEVSLTYNGKEQAGIPDTSMYTVKSGGTGKDIGEYRAVLSLKPGYAWADLRVADDNSAFGDKVIQWQIVSGGSTEPTDPDDPPGPEPIEPSIPDTPNDHLDPTDPTVTVEKDSIQNADGTITNVQTLTKTEEDGKTTTTVITTTPQNDGTVEEIKSTSNSQTNEGGIKTESSLETVTIKDPNGGVKSETHIEVSVIDTTGSSGTGTKGVTITANDKGGNATVKAVYQEGSQSASVVTEVKTSEENGQVVISHESLDVALKMQEMYSKKIVNENESVKDATKVIQVGSGSSDANVKLSSDIVKKIADADSAILVSGTAGSMEVSKGVMSNISEYDDIAISVAKAIEDVLTDEQKAAINSDATVVKVKVMSGDKSIGDKLNGEITISIKHVTAPGMVPVAYYVHDDGTMEKVDGKYNMKNNEMVVKTTHCSIYAVIDEAPESSSDGNILLYAGIAIAAVIIIAAIATFMLRRR